LKTATIFGKLLLPLLWLFIGIVGCGGGDDGPAAAPVVTNPAPPVAPPPPPQSAPAGRTVIDGDTDEASAVRGAWRIFETDYVYPSRVRPPVEGETLEAYVDAYRAADDIYTAYLDQNQTVIMGSDLSTGETLIVRTYEPGILYIAFDKFFSDTAQNVMDIVDNFVANGFTKLILDLRVNGGGFVDEAVALLDYFTTGWDGATLCRIRGPSISEDHVSQAPSPAFPKEFTFDFSNMVVLTSSFTASATEILVAGLVDFQEARQIGSTTFGKNRTVDTWSHARGDGFQLTTGIVYHSDGLDREGRGLTPNPTDITPDPFAAALALFGGRAADPLVADWEISEAAFANLYDQRFWRDVVFYARVSQSASMLWDIY
jgi:hypothetical protein